MSDSGPAFNAIDRVGSAAELITNVPLSADDSGGSAGFGPLDKAVTINNAPIRNNTTAPTINSGVGMPPVDAAGRVIEIDDNVGTRSLAVDCAGAEDRSGLATVGVDVAAIGFAAVGSIGVERIADPMGLAGSIDVGMAGGVGSAMIKLPLSSDDASASPSSPK